MGNIHIPGPSWNNLRRSKITSPYECSAMDFEILGKHSYNKQYYDRAYEFTKAAEIKAQKKEGLKNELKGIRKTLSAITREHDANLIRKGYQGNNWRTFRLPFNKTLAAYKRFKHIKNRKHRIKPAILNRIHPQILNYMYTSEQKTMLGDQFNMLCRGERSRSIKYENELQGFYLHHHQPFLKLGPFKMETRNKFPFLAIFHDFFHDKELEALIDYAQSSLKKSQTLLSRVSHATTRTRVSKQIWSEDDCEVFGSAGVASNRIALATLQNTTSISGSKEGGGEAFQVIK